MRCTCRLGQILVDQHQHWSLWHTHAFHLLLLAAIWRVGGFVFMLRREDRRERRDPHAQRRGL